MKIVLAALNAKYVHSNLAVYDLQSYAKEKLNKEFAGKEIPEIVIREYTINHNLDQILQSLYKEKATMIAFSCYIWNIKEILTISEELHKVAPAAHIWLGGPEVSYDSEKLLERYPWIEGIMRGEGEATFYDLVKYCGLQDSASDGNLELKTISGITYRDIKSCICKNPDRPLLSLDEIPFIYNGLEQFDNKILYYESSRGCPFSCSYCLSSIDKSVRFRSMDRVYRELQFFLDHKVNQVKFIDRTFNCNKKHSLAIWQYLAEHDNGITNFHFEVAGDLIGKEELEVFQKMRPGLIQLEIGLQSTNQATLGEIRRVMNVDNLRDTMHSIRGLHNIHQHLDLIAGLPYEDFVTFKQSFNEAYEMKPHQLQLGFLKVLKGSYMETQVDAYGLRYQNTQPYEVLSTKWLSYDDVLVLKQVEDMVEVYYNSGQFTHALNYLIPMFDSPFDFYLSLGRYYENKTLYGIGFKREMRYRVLRDFCLECFGKENVKNRWNVELFDSLLTFDYYLRENAKTRPCWSPDMPIDKTLYQNFFKNAGNDLYQFSAPDYDSKAAARMMHIEPVVKGALPYIVEESDFKVLTKEKDIEACDSPFDVNADRIYYCLYEYEKRNPLNRDGSVVILSHL